MLSALDGQFGPQFPGQFDFTLFFEHIMFKIIPSCFAVLAIPFYVRLSLREAKKARPGLLLCLKLLVGTALVGVSAASLGLWHQAAIRSSAALTAAAMSLLSSICVMVFLYTSHVYSIRPSSFLSLFLTITALLDIAVTRSYFRRPDLHTIGTLQACALVFKIILVGLEEVSKRALLCTEALRSSTASETLAGFWNRTTFAWFFTTMIFAFKNELTTENLPDIEQELDIKGVYERFARKWDAAKKSSKFGLLLAIFWTMPWPIIKVIPGRMMFVGLQFSQPFLLFHVVSAVRYSATPEISSGLVGATALVFTGIAVTRVFYEHTSYRMLTLVRGILIVAIYEKMQHLPSMVLDKLTAITLITADVAAVESMLKLVYEVWAALLLASLGIWALSLFVGGACFLMVIPGIITFIISHFLGIEMMRARKAWNEEMESRIAATSNILAQIKSVKAMGLSQRMLEYLQEKRQKEIAVSMSDRRARVILFGSLAFGYALAPTLVLAGALFWTRVKNPLSTAEVFTVLSIVQVTSEPVNNLLTSFTFWSGGFASMQRIQQFLCGEEAKDMRVVTAAHSDEGTSGFEEKKVGLRSRLGLSAPFAVQFDLVTVNSEIMGSILKEVSFNIPWGSLVMFWGSISSGKSTLLKSAIGEVKLDSGVITVGTKDIAYCSQESWLRNSTVRKTVTGVLDFISEWYNEVMTACCLDIDLAAFAGGDGFFVGSGGCNLSGGQKQRLSLARAVYAQTDIMVIDDILSALDPATAKAVFVNLFGKEGLVRRWNCTVIMTTNQLNFLEHADLSFRMHKGGCVEQQQNVSSEKLSLSDASESREKQQAEVQVSDADEAQRTEGKAEASPEAAFPSVKLNADDNLALRNARQKRKSGDWSLYRYFFAAVNLGVVILSLCIVATAAFVQASPQIYVKIWYGKNGRDRLYFVGYVLVSAAMVFFNSVNGLIYFYLVIPKSSEGLHFALAETTMFATMKYLANTDSGELLNRFSQDMSLTSQQLPLYLLHFLHIFFAMLIDIAVIVAGTKYLSPIVIVILAALYGVQFFYLRTSRQLRLLELESSSALVTHFSETTAGIHTIRSFGWQKAYLDQLYEALSRSQRPFYLLFCSQRWLTVVLDLISAATGTLLVLVSFKVPGGTSDSSVGLALFTLVGFSSLASDVIRAWTVVETSLGAVSRIKDFATDTPQEKDSLDSQIEAEWPNAGRLDFDCVSVSYESQDGSSQKALDEISFTIQPGDKVGISGRTGSGKSSMFMTVLHMTDFKGTLSIDGKDTKTVDREKIRQRITTLTQDGVELRGPLRFNVYPFGGEIPDDETIMDTLQSLGLEEQVVGHGGLDGDMVDMCFSVSQKQLFFLARGILHHQTMKTRIILMDEATSAMDSDANTHLQELFDEKFGNCTVLQISHRPDSFRAADLHVKLESGKVINVQRK
ncbi:hypothetical protein NLG97_g2398 [Lecanicillium saksenae]|uniref:Uncharacterized protein n=1 Tax=Lecanicillium saksenae TaxID=468837 RepID=A0ACC1R3N8_9HYPO|nr:hypothetical protein NLG97_g2398 [Lecanicillium saksenae]